MPEYRFRCRACGRFDADYSMATVPDTSPCPSCDGQAHRVITAAALSRAGSSAMRLLDATGATADRPAVITGAPPGAPTAPPRPVSHNPLHQRLPRP